MEPISSLILIHPTFRSIDTVCIHSVNTSPYFPAFNGQHAFFSSLPSQFFSAFVRSRYDEIQIVEAIRSSDHSAFTQLVLDTQEDLYTYAKSLVESMSLAEDIVQDVYSALWIRRQSWTLRGSLRAYLRRAVRNRAIDVGRRERRLRSAAEGASIRRYAPDADQRVLTRDLEVTTLHILETLPLRYRQVFLLCGVCDWPHAKAAMTLQIAPQTVNYYLVFARKEIMRQLQARHIDIPRWITTPEMIFTTGTSPARTGSRVRAGNVEVLLVVNTDRHDPEQPFASADVRVRIRRQRPKQT
jgi:RNA polymerase sigma-70 factor (ECF subfamily)